MRPCRVGLTGGLASGKSTVAVLLARRGAEVMDADGVVHHLYRRGGEGSAIVVRLFGQEMLRPDGSVDRDRLGERVLADDAARLELNAAVHPLVRDRVGRWLEDLGQRPRPPSVAVVEASLLVETGGCSAYEVLAVVWCRAEQQLDRAVARGVDETRARAILAAQMPIDSKRKVADVVIDNSGAREALPAEVERAWQEIVARCGATGGG